MPVTTDKDFQAFKKECLFWIKFFGLYEYQIVIAHVGDPGALASSKKREIKDDRHVRVSLSKVWEWDAITHHSICCVAFHEIMECMLWEMADLAEDGRGRAHERNATHKLIRVFENTVFEDSYQRRYRCRKV